MVTNPVPSSVETFARELFRDTKPGDAIHRALEGVDPKRLAVFSKELRSHMTLGYPMTADDFADALRRSGAGHSKQDNVKFARQIQSAFGADASAAVSDPFYADQANVIHGVIRTVNDGVDAYTRSLDGPPGASVPTQRHGARPSFNKAALSPSDVLNQHVVDAIRNSRNADPATVLGSIGATAAPRANGRTGPKP